ncbi:sensor histidine kinase KdpD [Flexivirga sp. ID2601S]|uniref:histidine kinase n=1 Tax=Flexivirga aerilata TaxID=1656889 RepID=A0A849AMD6_9MICO|nr:ATP-binding protein [Flexivirga aerilata]NNG39520.1 sensor histidine kinase KdpD [Flexivirga aerilata]
MSRGRLRIFLGSAPGVGKTVKMLQEAQRRRARGTDVVVGLVETHDRAYTAAQLDGLEVLPRREVVRDGATLHELDVDAVLRRRPEVVLVDELAHSNAGGAGHERRFEDIEQLLDAGIDVISTVNVQHLESLNDAVFQITGIRQQETVPDAVVRAADQIELVDMTPEALRRRLAHGNVYAADRVDAALANYFRAGNLSALRELALLWTADRVDEALARYRDDHDIDSTWPVRERVVVALTGGPEQETLLRRGARIASRGAGGELYAVQVVPDTGLRDVPPESATAARQLVAELGGTMHTVTGSDVGEAILEFARGVNASQIIVGASRRSRWQRLLGRGVGDTVVDGSGDIDVLMVSHELAHAGRSPAVDWDGLGLRREVAGWLLATVGVALLTWIIDVTSQGQALPLDVLIYLAFTVITAIVGGLWPALTSAVLASLALNWYFTPPEGTLTISQPQNAFALLVFVVVAVAVASVVHLTARRTARAIAAERDSRLLAELTHSLLAVKDQLPVLLDQARDIFDADGAALVRTTTTGVPGQPVMISGEVPLQELDARLTRAPVDDEHQLVIAGDVADAGQRRLVEAYASVAAAILHRNELAKQAAAAAGLAKDNRSRAALLAAVSHDLRTPLAAIKAGVSSLRSTDIQLTAADQRELLETVEESTDRLDGLIENLLDMSRIQSGSITARTDELQVGDLVSATLHTVSEPHRVRSWLPDPHLTCLADAGLAERVLANLLENALRYSPGRQEVVLSAERLGKAVEVRVIDRGPGVPASERTGIFAPFQRYGDSPRGNGVGLGLAVAKGLTEAMDGTLDAEDTPGGGLTMCVRLPVVDHKPGVAHPAESAQREGASS